MGQTLLGAFFFFNFNFFIKKLFYFWLHWVSVAVHRLALIGEREGYFLGVVRGLLIMVASLVAELGSRLHGL